MLVSICLCIVLIHLFKYSFNHLFMLCVNECLVTPTVPCSCCAPRGDTTLSCAISLIFQISRTWATGTERQFNVRYMYQHTGKLRVECYISVGPMFGTGPPGLKSRKMTAGPGFVLEAQGWDLVPCSFQLLAKRSPFSQWLGSLLGFQKPPLLLGSQLSALQGKCESSPLTLISPASSPTSSSCSPTLLPSSSTSRGQSHYVGLIQVAQYNLPV